jgi:hypothetical protein
MADSNTQVGGHTDGNNLGLSTEPPPTPPQWYDQVEGMTHMEAPLRYIPFFWRRRPYRECNILGPGTYLNVLFQA